MQISRLGILIKIFYKNKIGSSFELTKNAMQKRKSLKGFQELLKYFKLLMEKF